MDLSVAIVSYNTRDLLHHCLDSVVETAAGLDWETIVVDNDSIDGSAEMVAREFPSVTLVRNQANLGFAGANNQALAMSRGRYILLLNSDCRLLPGSLAAMVGFMDGHPEAGAVGVQLLNPDGSFQASYARFPSLWGEFLLQTRLYRRLASPCYPSAPLDRSLEIRRVDWVFGACMMVRCSVVDAVGPLDEGYFMYTEETDWCYRMREAGWAVYYLPDARAIHWSGQSARRAPEQKRSRLYRSKGLFMRKHRGRLAEAALYWMVRAASAVKLLFWSCRGLTGDRPSRERALMEINSYRLLLREL